MKTKVKLAFLAFLTTTIIWAYTFIITFQEYRSAMLGQPWWLTRPYYDWNIGGIVCITGGFLIFAWTFFIPFAMGKLSVKEILEVIKAVPYSIFHMDYLTEIQKENETKKRKVSKFKLVFIVLFIATVIWAMILYYTLQGYREYCEWFDEQPWSEWGLREPYLSWNGGFYVFIAGACLLAVWFGFIIAWWASRFEASNS